MLCKLSIHVTYMHIKKTGKKYSNSLIVAILRDDTAANLISPLYFCLVLSQVPGVQCSQYVFKVLTMGNSVARFRS